MGMDLAHVDCDVVMVSNAMVCKAILNKIFIVALLFGFAVNRLPKQSAVF